MAPRLLLLMMAPFAFATGAYVFAGLLEPMSEDLGVSVPVVGQLQSAFAIASAIGGPILAVLTNGFERKRLLVIVLLTMAVANAASALATSFSVLAVARATAGLIGALTLPVALAIAVSLVAPERKAAAIAVVFAGTALAFLIGIPLGSVVGSAYGWPASFWLATGLALAAALGIALLIPTTSSPPPPPEGALAAATQAPAKGLLAVTFLSFLAAFVSVAFIGPVVTALTGLKGAGIGVMQLFIGVGGLVGLFVGARLSASMGLRALTPLMVTVMVSQACFTLGQLIELGPELSIIFTAASIGVGAGALFALSPIVQAALADIAGAAATVAFALNGSVVFFGQGLGAVVGGGVIDQAGLLWTGLTGAALAFITLGLTQRLRGAELPERTSSRLTIP